MLDNNLQIEKREAQEFAPLPENIYQVQLLDVTAEEKATYDTRNKADEEKEYETIMNFQFTLLSGKDGDEELRGRNVWQNFVPTYLYVGNKGKNKLFQIVEAFLGRDLTPQEEAEGITGEFINALVGKQCRIGTKNKTSGEKIFTNIETYYPAETYMISLTDEEIEKATVKKDNDDKAYTDVKEKAKDEGFNVDQVEDVEEIDLANVPL